jgi:hypothetical protein
MCGRTERRSRGTVATDDAHPHRVGAVVGHWLHAGRISGPGERTTTTTLAVSAARVIAVTGWAMGIQRRRDGS